MSRARKEMRSPRSDAKINFSFARVSRKIASSPSFGKSAVRLLSKEDFFKELAFLVLIPSFSPRVPGERLDTQGYFLLKATVFFGRLPFLRVLKGWTSLHGGPRKNVNQPGRPN